MLCRARIAWVLNNSPAVDHVRYVLFTLQIQMRALMRFYAEFAVPCFILKCIPLAFLDLVRLM